MAGGSARGTSEQPDWASRNEARREICWKTQPPATSGDDVIAGVSDGAYALLVADFADTESAWAAYEDLKSVEDGATVAIEGVVVVKRGADGKLDIQKATDHSSRSGLKWGGRRWHGPRCHLPALHPWQRGGAGRRRGCHR